MTTLYTTSGSTYRASVGSYTSAGVWLRAPVSHAVPDGWEEVVEADWLFFPYTSVNRVKEKS